MYKTSGQSTGGVGIRGYELNSTPPSRRAATGDRLLAGRVEIRAEGDGGGRGGVGEYRAVDVLSICFHSGSFFWWGGVGWVGLREQGRFELFRG